MVICSPKPSYAIHMGEKCAVVTITTITMIVTETSADGEAWGESESEGQRTSG